LCCFFCGAEFKVAQLNDLAQVPRLNTTATPVRSPNPEANPALAASAMMQAWLFKQRKVKSSTGDHR